MKKTFKGLFLLAILSLTLSSCEFFISTSSTTSSDSESTTTITTSDDPITTTTTSEDPNNGGDYVDPDPDPDPDPDLGGGSTTETNDVSVRSVLNQLQETPFAYKGTAAMVIAEDSSQEVVYSESYYLEGYLSEDAYIYIVKDEDGNEITHSEYFPRTEFNLIGTKQLNPITNEVVSSYYSSYNFYSRYYNPFVFVSESMGTLVGNTVTFELSKTAAYQIFCFFFGGDTSSFYGTGEITVTIDTTSGDIESVSLVSDKYYETIYGVPYTGWYEFNYTYVTLADIDAYWTEPVEDDGSTSALASAFNELSNGNYSSDVTITYQNEVIDEATLKMTDDIIIIDDGETLYGYANTSDGYQSFSTTSGNTNLRGNSVSTSGSIADVKTQFSILSYMFENKGNNTYVYANRGTEDYLIYTMPEYLYVSKYLDYYSYYSIDEGSYTWTLNDDGTIDIQYTFLYYDINVKVYDINTTSIGGYTFTEYTLPTSWSEVDGAVELLAEYGITDQLPWFDEIQTGWTASNYGYYGSLTSDLFRDYSHSIDWYESYIIETLESEGWFFVGNSYNGNYEEYMFSYSYYEQPYQTSLYIGVGFEYTYYGYWSNGNYSSYYDIVMHINVYEPGIDILPEGLLSIWLSDNFSDPNNMNYTTQVIYSQCLTPFDYDQDTQTFGDLCYDDEIFEEGYISTFVDQNIGYIEEGYTAYYGQSSIPDVSYNLFQYWEIYDNQVDLYSKYDYGDGNTEEWSSGTYDGYSSVAEIIYTPNLLVDKEFYATAGGGSYYMFRTTTDVISILLSIAGLSSWTGFSSYITDYSITYEVGSSELYVYLNLDGDFLISEDAFEHGHNAAHISLYLELIIRDVGYTIVESPL